MLNDSLTQNMVKQLISGECTLSHKYVTARLPQVVDVPSMVLLEDALSVDVLAVNVSLLVCACAVQTRCSLTADQD